MKKRKTIFYSYHLSNFLSHLLNKQKSLETTYEYFLTKFLFNVVISLKKSGLIHNFILLNPKKKNIMFFNRGRIRLYLKYVDEAPLIKDIFVYSTPGRRIYINKFLVKKMSTFNVGSLLFISTAQYGIVDHVFASKRNLGGLLLFKVNY